MSLVDVDLSTLLVNGDITCNNNGTDLKKELTSVNHKPTERPDGCANGDCLQRDKNTKQLIQVITSNHALYLQTDKLYKEKLQLQCQVAERAQHLEHLAAQLRAKEDEVTQLKSQYEALEMQKQESDNLLKAYSDKQCDSEVKRDKKYAASSLQQHKDKLKDQERQFQNLDQKYKEAARKYRDCVDKMVEFDKRANKAEADALSQRTKCHKLKDQVNELRGRLAQSEKEKNSLRRDLENIQKMVTGAVQKVTGSRELSRLRSSSESADNLDISMHEEPEEQSLNDAPKSPKRRKKQAKPVELEEPSVVPAVTKRQAIIAAQINQPVVVSRSSKTKVRPTQAPPDLSCECQKFDIVSMVQHYGRDLWSTIGHAPLSPLRPPTKQRRVASRAPSGDSMCVRKSSRPVRPTAAKHTEPTKATETDAAVVNDILEVLVAKVVSECEMVQRIEAEKNLFTAPAAPSPERKRRRQQTPPPSPLSQVKRMQMPPSLSPLDALVKAKGTHPTRARPRKALIESETLTQDNKLRSVSDTVEPAESETRPENKESTSDTIEPETSGRPRKSRVQPAESETPAQSKKSDLSDSNSPKAMGGRPRKSRVQSAESEPPPAQDKTSLSDQIDPKTVPPKKRGRPRKTPESETPAQKKNSASGPIVPKTVGRGRGRPRKSRVESAESETPAQKKKSKTPAQNKKSPSDTIEPKAGRPRKSRVESAESETPAQKKKAGVSKTPTQDKKTPSEPVNEPITHNRSESISKDPETQANESSPIKPMPESPPPLQIASPEPLEIAEESELVIAADEENEPPAETSQETEPETETESTSAAVTDVVEEFHAQQSPPRSTKKSFRAEVKNAAVALGDKKQKQAWNKPRKDEMEQIFKQVHPFLLNAVAGQDSSLELIRRFGHLTSQQLAQSIADFLLQNTVDMWYAMCSSLRCEPTRLHEIVPFLGKKEKLICAFLTTSKLSAHWPQLSRDLIVRLGLVVAKTDDNVQLLGTVVRCIGKLANEQEELQLFRKLLLQLIRKPAEMVVPILTYALATRPKAFDDVFQSELDRFLWRIAITSNKANFRVVKQLFSQLAPSLETEEIQPQALADLINRKLAMLGCMEAFLVSNDSVSLSVDAETLLGETLILWCRGDSVLPPTYKQEKLLQLCAELEAWLPAALTQRLPQVKENSIVLIFLARILPNSGSKIQDEQLAKKLSSVYRHCSSLHSQTSQNLSEPVCRVLQLAVTEFFNSVLYKWSETNCVIV